MSLTEKSPQSPFYLVGELECHVCREQFKTEELREQHLQISGHKLDVVASLDGGARQAFEEFAKFQMLDGTQRGEDGRYLNHDVQFAHNVWRAALNYAFGKAAEMAENTSQLPKLAARLRQMQGKP